MQIVESGDDYYEPRFSNGSMSCLFPSLAFVDSPRKISYNKLQKQPLRLTVIKLDGTSFGIEVPKTGTVSEIKRAVEAVFDHFPKYGPGRVSWEHVWGQFCLCHEGQKLLIDSDYISMIGIRDGDQLQFVHHASNTCNFVKIKCSKEDPEVDDKPPRKIKSRKSYSDVGYMPHISNGYKDVPQYHGRDYCNYSEINTEESEDNHSESEDDIVSRREYKLSRMLKGWFPYQKLNSSHKKLGERSCSSISCPSSKSLESFKTGVRFSSDRYDSRELGWKRK